MVTPPTRPLRVLVADDSAMNRDVAAAFLHAAGHAVVEAADGDAALRIVAAEAFDVVLMDLRMPVLDGIEATRHIRALPGQQRPDPDHCRDGRRAGGSRRGVAGSRIPGLADQADRSDVVAGGGCHRRGRTHPGHGTAGCGPAWTTRPMPVPDRPIPDMTDPPDMPVPDMTVQFPEGIAPARRSTITLEIFAAQIVEPAGPAGQCVLRPIARRFSRRFSRLIRRLALGLAARRVPSVAAGIVPR